MTFGRHALTGFLLLVLASPSGWAAWLGECQTLPANANVLDTISDPSGASTYLVVSDTQPSNCSAQLVPIDRSDITSAHLVSPTLSAQLRNGFALSFEGTARELQAAEIIPLAEPSVPNPHVLRLILGNNLLPEMTAHPFGTEERATTSQAQGHIQLTCRAGTQPAGAVLTFPAKALPQAMPTQIQLQYEGNAADVALAMSDQHRLTREDPLPVGVIRPTTTPSGAQRIQNVAFAIPGPIDPNLRAVTVSCPPHEAQLQIRDISMHPTAPSATANKRATWLWNPTRWQHANQSLFHDLRAANIKTLFVTVPVDVLNGQISESDVLAQFITQARQHGIDVWAVVGDPKAVIPAERPKFAQMASAYARYNQSVPPTAQLAGIQYDIEPYLNPGYSIDPKAWLDAFITTLHELKDAAPSLPMDIVVPFFWADEETRRGPLLDQMAPMVQGLTVMAYRTDPALIRTFAQPFLEWGARNPQALKTVRIALELGPIPDSQIVHYAPSEAGQTALINGKQYGALLGLKRTTLKQTALRQTNRTLHTFEPTQTRNNSGNTITFAHRRPEFEALLPELETLWSGWPSFAGTALHEYFPAIPLTTP